MNTPWRLMAAMLCVGSVALTPPPTRAATGARDSQSRGVLVGIDAATGARRFRARTPGPASLTVVFASDGIVVAERRGCFSADRPNPDGDTVLVGYDDETGREVWHRAGLVTVGPQTGGWTQLRPGVLPVRRPRTEERLGLDPRTGEDVWSRGANSDYVRASTHGMLVTSGGGHNGDRAAGVDRDNGRTRWSYEVDGNRRMALIAAGNNTTAIVVVDPPAPSYEAAASVGTAMHLLDTRTGEVRRVIPLQLDVDQKLRMRAVEVAGSTVVLDVGELIGFDVETGRERWRGSGALGLGLLPNTGSDTLIVEAAGGTGVAVLDPETGRTRWTHTSRGRSFAVAVAGSNLVALTDAGYRAFDLASGRRQWVKGPERGVFAVGGMAARHLSLAGGCPVTSAD